MQAEMSALDLEG